MTPASLIFQAGECCFALRLHLDAALTSKSGVAIISSLPGWSGRAPIGLGSRPRIMCRLTAWHRTRIEHHRSPLPRSLASENVGRLAERPSWPMKKAALLDGSLSLGHSCWLPDLRQCSSQELWWKSCSNHWRKRTLRWLHDNSQQLIEIEFNRLPRRDGRYFCLLPFALRLEPSPMALASVRRCSA